jgi:hypothetical protein
MKQEKNTTGWSDTTRENGARTTSTDEELRQLIREHVQTVDEGSTTKKPSKKKRKKPTGRCMICGENQAKSICIKCDRAVCSACYFHLVGLCKKCLSKETVEQWKRTSPDWEKMLGVEWID